MRRLIQLFITALVSIMIVACSPISGMNQDNVDLIKQSLKDSVKEQPNSDDEKSTKVELDQDTQDVLTPDLVSEDKKEKRFDVNVTDMPAKTFFYSLMESTPHSIAVAPDVEGSISLQLKNVTLSQTLAAVHNLYGFQIEKNSYGYTVYPRQLQTKLFVLHRINMGRQGTSESSITNPGLGQAKASTTRISPNSQAVSLKSTFDSNDYWDQIEATIAGIVSQTPGTSFQVNKETGVILVRATSDELEQVAQFIQMTTDIGSREVLIEAKIMEVRLFKEYDTGINWSQMGLSYDSATGIVTINPPVTDEDFESVIKLLSTQGQVTVLSSPRISTVNNQQALIKVGNDRYYVTDVSTDTTPVGTTAQLSSNVTLEPFFSGIALEVLPDIQKDGQITLFIHPVISDTQDDERKIELSELQTLVLPLAKSDVRESDSIVKVRDNQVIILGGLMESGGKTSHSTLPFLQDYNAETGASDSGSISELVIMLKATIISGNQQWNDAIIQSRQEINTVMDQYSKGMS